MEIWFSRKHKGIKVYDSKLITIRFLPQHWKLLHCKSNRAVKGVDSCYDFNIYFLGVFISYTNFDYKD